ncbi:hypothetical protein EIP91_003370 [Steccherinum ochraceum]|uniref:DUF7587 domain-containing protein n=1 Tax=Steccherinum ochraceum TaxID=92696 RepID=A0A4R0RC95_9APHY|nr:hypothetical protein EIP91_003370 [Steccherinum ochraceum]
MILQAESSPEERKVADYAAYQVGVVHGKEVDVNPILSPHRSPGSICNVHPPLCADYLNSTAVPSRLPVLFHYLPCRNEHERSTPLIPFPQRSDLCNSLNTESPHVPPTRRSFYPEYGLPASAFKQEPFLLSLSSSEEEADPLTTPDASVIEYIERYSYDPKASSPWIACTFNLPYVIWEGRRRRKYRPDAQLYVSFVRTQLLPNAELGVVLLRRMGVCSGYQRKGYWFANSHQDVLVHQHIPAEAILVTVRWDTLIDSLHIAGLLPDDTLLPSKLPKQSLHSFYAPLHSAWSFQLTELDAVKQAISWIPPQQWKKLLKMYGGGYVRSVVQLLAAAVMQWKSLVGGRVVSFVAAQREVVRRVAIDGPLLDEERSPVWRCPFGIRVLTGPPS